MVADSVGKIYKKTFLRYFETLQLVKENRKNQTEAEKFLWEKVRNRKIKGLKFNRQFLLEYKQIMGNKLYYIADFHNFENKLIIEIDGTIHQYQAEYDREREEDIKTLGYKVLRFTNEEVLNQWHDVEQKLLL
jgi:5-methyltetrahydrofolate--homocysteine methyltransferase